MLITILDQEFSLLFFEVRDTLVPFNNNYKDYEKVGIAIRAYKNPQNLIAFGDFVRYLNEIARIM